MPRRTEEEELATRRSRRNEFYDKGVYPKGDKPVNPERMKTAYDYDTWRHTVPSHHRDEGAFLNNLESEERASGKSSYPAGHPRRVALEAGKNPDMEDLRSKGSFGASAASQRPLEGFAAQETLLGSTAAPRAPRVAPALRTNHFPTRCASCGYEVKPGDGSVTKTSGAYQTRHYPQCP